MSIDKITQLLGSDADTLLSHQCKTFSKDQLHIPSPDFMDRLWVGSNRNPQVLRSLGA